MEEEIPPVFVPLMGRQCQCWGRNKSFSVVSCKYCKYGWGWRERADGPFQLLEYQVWLEGRVNLNFLLYVLKLQRWIPYPVASGQTSLGPVNSFPGQLLFCFDVAPSPDPGWGLNLLWTVFFLEKRWRLLMKCPALNFLNPHPKIIDQREEWQGP